MKKSLAFSHKLKYSYICENYSDYMTDKGVPTTGGVPLFFFYGSTVDVRPVCCDEQ